MDVFSTELGIRLSFVKTSEFRGWSLNPPTPLFTPLMYTHSPSNRVFPDHFRLPSLFIILLLLLTH